MVQRHLSDASSQSSALIARAAALEQQAAAAAAERDALAAALRRERDVARALRESRDVLQSDLTHSFVCLTRSSGRCDSLEEDYDKLHREYQELIKLFDQEADLVSRYVRRLTTARTHTGMHTDLVTIRTHTGGKEQGKV